jgi:hemoglobin
MKKDLEQRADIELLITRFYDKVIADDVIGYIFNDIAKVNWPKHLPIMFDFWENVLFFTGTYEGNPMTVHQHLHRVVPLTKAHFDRWYQLFSQTVDELFEGNNAMLAKQRALSIATIMQVKIIQPLT